MTLHPVFRLGDIADVAAGDPAPQDAAAFAPDGPLFVRMQDVGRDHVNPALRDSADRLDPDWLRRNRLRLVPRNSILIPKSGASVNLNHRAKLATDAYVVSHLAVVVPDRTRIDPDYLFWWSVRYDPREQVQVTSLPSLKLSTLKEARIPVPSLNEQRRIASILNRSVRIERLRATVIDHARSLSLALFRKMFGDPVEKPGGEATFLGDVATSIKSGFACRKSNLVDKGLAHLRPFNIGRNAELDMTDVYRIPHNFAPKSKNSLCAGDIMFNNTNSPSLVGKVALVRHDVEASFSNHMTRIRVDRSQCEPAYIAVYMQYLWLTGYYMNRCTQWVGQAAYGPRLLSRTPIHLPPLDKQRQFAHITDRTTSTALAIETGARAASALSASLMARLLEQRR